MRPTGMPFAMRSLPPSRNGSSHISVSTQPGATAFTVMPCGATSTATDLTKAIMAPFDAA